MISEFRTSEEREKREKRMRKLSAYFVIAILFFSIMAYSVLSIHGNSQTKYGKFNFEQTYDGWKVKAGDFVVLTQFHPNQVEDIEFTGNIDDFSNIVYLVSKTEAEREAAEEISKNLLSLKTSIACLPEDSESEECFNMTAKSCADADYLEKVIVIKEKEEDTSIIYSNNCLAITGNNSLELIRASDKFLYKVLGIIK